MSGAALYVEIYEKILDAIQRGEYTENAPLPSERSLCERYHVSRSTIRQAIQLLKETEVVYTVQGNGTFVKPQVFTQPLTKFYSFTDTLKSSNILIQNEIVHYHTITWCIESVWQVTGKSIWKQSHFADFETVMNLRFRM